MNRTAWIATALAFGLGTAAFAAASDGQATWEGQDSRGRSPVSLLKLLKQYDGPVDLSVTGAPQKCISATNASGIALNDREIIYQQNGQIYHNALKRPCPGFGSGKDGSSVVIPAPSQVTYPAGNSSICSGHAVRINDGHGTGPARCVLGDFVPVEVMSATSASDQ
jgi:hypothetical protein